MDDSSRKPYKVGYGKPPVEGQFKKGESGRSRRKAAEPSPGDQDSDDLLDKFRQVAKTKICLTEGGKKKKIDRRTATVTKLSHMALSGDLKAMVLWLKYIEKADSAAPNDDGTGTTITIYGGLPDDPIPPPPEDDVSEGSASTHWSTPK